MTIERECGTPGRPASARAVIELLIAMTLAACSGASPPGASSPGSPGGGPPVSTPTATALVDPGTPPPTPPVAELCRRQILVATHDQLGRRLTDDERRAVRLILEENAGGATMDLFTDGVHDFQCESYYTTCVSCGPRVEAYAWSSHFPDGLSPDRPVVVGPQGGGSEGFAGYTWGAVAPEVASLRVAPEGGVEQEAILANGYFLVLFESGPCCIFTAVAYDAAGKEIYRSR